MWCVRTASDRRSGRARAPEEAVEGPKGPTRGRRCRPALTRRLRQQAAFGPARHGHDTMSVSVICISFGLLPAWSGARCAQHEARKSADWPRRCQARLIFDVAAQLLRACAPSLLVEPPLLRRLRRRGRRAGAPPLRRRTELLDDAVGRELAVAQLRALVLRDRADDRAEPLEHPAPLRCGEGRRRLDVEERLDARRALLRVLSPRPAGAGEAERDFRP